MTAHYKLTNKQSGDTIVEVMLATVIMSVIVSASFALVNRASRINQVSSERSEATNAMQSQAETLRLWRDAAIGQNGDAERWEQIKKDKLNDAGAVGSNNECANFLSGGTDPTGDKAFYFGDDLSLISFATPNIDAPNIDGRYFVWVEGFTGNGYIDFYVHSCWQGPGGTGPQQGSLVYRLAQ